MLSSRVRILFFGVALSAALAGIVSGQELTEAQILERFLARSPHIRVIRASLAATQAEAQVRTRFPNPTATYSREGAGLTEFLQIEQPLILTRRRGYLQEAGAAAVAAAELSSRRALWNLRSNLRQAFYQVLAAQERLRILQGSMAELDEVIRVLSLREAEGEGSKYDRLRAERELIDSRIEFAAARVTLEQARSRVSAFFPDMADLQAMKAAGSFGRPRAAPALEELGRRALENRSDYQSEKNQAQRYQKEKLAAERLRIPDPIVTAGFKRGEVLPTTVNGYVVSISIPIPLFNRGRAEVARAQAEYERALGTLDVLEQQIRADVAGAYLTFETRRSAAEAYQSELEHRGAELTSIAQLSHQEGEWTILELLDAYRVARQGQLRVLDLLAATKEAEIELERAVGEEVFP